MAVKITQEGMKKMEVPLLQGTRRLRHEHTSQFCEKEIKFPGKAEQ